MRCDQAQADLSSAADGELETARAEPLAAHVAGCAVCTAFSDRLAQIRRQLRFEPVGEVPDMAAAVVTQLRREAAAVPAGGRPVSAGRRQRTTGRRRLLPAAAVFLVGAVAGAAFAGLGRDAAPPAFAVGLPTRVLAAQTALRSLEGQVELIETGWHPDVPRRRFTGTLSYRAPESLALRLEDRTRYPSPAWRRNDVDLVVDGASDTWWTSGVRDCPTEALPSCAPPADRLRVVDGREPFAAATPVPLDLVLPAASFRLAAPPPDLGARRLDGREVLGVAVTAAQIAPLLDGLRPAGNLRLTHPTDPAELWLDRKTLVPLEVDVRAGNSTDRRRWAATHGYSDRPGAPLLRFRLTGVAVNRPVPDGVFPPAPADPTVRQSGAFAAGAAPAGTPAPDVLPPGMLPWRAGTVSTPGGPPVSVVSFTDGRAWVVVRSTRAWPGGRLFGDPGGVVRRLDLGPAGVAYAAEDGSRVAIHGDSVDLVVAGSLAPADLRRVAASTGVVGQPVPDGWAEAATATVDDARRALPNLLLPSTLRGFGPPAVRVDGLSVTVAYAGAGERAFVLTEAPGRRLLPPLDPDARTVRVRNLDARWSSDRGELEWTEGGLLVTLRSSTLALGELADVADVADRLRRP